jgi:hypothetical protein
LVHVGVLGIGLNGWLLADQHTLNKLGKNRELVEIDRTLSEMVCGRVVLGKVVAPVGGARRPVDQEMVLLDTVTEPIKLHVYGTWTFLFHGAIDDA